MAQGQFEPTADQPVSPSAIVHNSLLETHEKLDLLHDLKAQAVGAQQEGAPSTLDTDEIDHAIAQLRDTAAAGGTEPAHGGVF